MSIEKYSERLVNSIYKYLCLIEEEEQNAEKYLNSLLVELEGSLQYYDNDYLNRILFSLNGLQGIEDYNIVRSKVFECINLCNKINKGG